MRPILFLLCLSLALPSVAQRFSTGLRTGAVYVPETNLPWDVVKERSGGWSKSAFGRYESKGRFAIDLNIAHNRFNYTYSIPQRTEFAPPTHEILDHRSKNDVFTSDIALQIRATNRRSPIRSYFGAGVSYGREIALNTIVRKKINTGQISEDKQTYSSGLVFCGLNNYTSYTISNHLNIHSTVSVDVDPFDALSSFRPANTLPASRLSWTIGCGYTF